MDVGRLAAAAAVIAAVAATLGFHAVSLWCAVADHRSVLNAVFDAGVVLAFTVVGSVIVAARPGNVIGWTMLAGGVFWSAGGAGVDLAHHGLVASPGAVAGASAFAVAGSAAHTVGWYLVTTAMPVYFPDGHLAGPRWRWLRTALVVVLVAGILDSLTDPRADLRGLGSWRNPIAPHGAAQLVSAVAFLCHIPLSLVVTVAAVVQMVRRWQAGGPLVRQQLGLFAAAAAATLVAVPIAFGLGGGGWVFGAAALPLPLAIGFAVLARGLYDLRTAANRTLAWTTLSAAIVGIFAAVVAGLASVLHVSRSTSWLPWIAAGLVAVVFAPLRDALQRAVNRVTFGRWDEPYDVLAAIGQRAEATADVPRLLGDVVAELTALGLRSVTIVDASGEVVIGPADAGPVDDRGPRTDVALAAYGEPVGTLRYTPPATPLRARDLRLLDDLAAHLGSVVHAQRLTLDLQRALERLVLAREEERRRLRRDLHDGLGPALAGHLLRLDALAACAREHPDALAGIRQLRVDLASTMAEVRRLVEGLRPPAIDELGLVAALEQAVARLAAGSGLTVRLVADVAAPLPAAVEVAAYRIVTEAVTNVVKHADASVCRVCLRLDDDQLGITVEDDGAGLPATPAGQGHGLQTMRERAEELRGRLHVGPAADGRGCRIVARLPLLARRSVAVLEPSAG
ncbi:MAG TPA: sensor histidine kinase [Mycobacteriales bacterium]|nr:sensor histidine kinase [Mycobacteriales bacterium]